MWWKPPPRRDPNLRTSSARQAAGGLDLLEHGNERMFVIMRSWVPATRFPTCPGELELRDELLVACRAVLLGVATPRAAALVGHIDALLDLDDERSPGSTAGLVGRLTSALPTAARVTGYSGMSADVPAFGAIARRRRLEDAVARPVPMTIDLDTLTPDERRDLANALLRAAWSATLAETRTLLLDLLVEADATCWRGRADDADDSSFARSPRPSPTCSRSAGLSASRRRRPVACSTPRPSPSCSGASASGSTPTPTSSARSATATGRAPVSDSIAGGRAMEARRARRRSRRRGRRSRSVSATEQRRTLIPVRGLRARGLGFTEMGRTPTGSLKLETLADGTRAFQLRFRRRRPARARDAP